MGFHKHRLFREKTIQHILDLPRDTLEKLQNIELFYFMVYFMIYIIQDLS